MFKKNKKRKCSNCGKSSKNMVNFAGYDICSEHCMIDLFGGLTKEEIIELDKIDREINGYDKLFSKLPFLILAIINIINKNLLGLILDIIVIYCNVQVLIWDRKK